MTQAGHLAFVNLFRSIEITETDAPWLFKGLPSERFSTAYAMVGVKQTASHLLCQLNIIKYENERISQVRSKFMAKQSMSYLQPCKANSFKPALWHFPFSARHATEWDSCHIIRHVISEWHFSEMVCKTWLNVMWDIVCFWAKITVELCVKYIITLLKFRLITLGCMLWKCGTKQQVLQILSKPTISTHKILGYSI